MISDTIISTGSNLNNRLQNLAAARNLLAEHFDIVETSRIYESKAVDYTTQPDFLNQVLHLKISKDRFSSPCQLVEFFLQLEEVMGRQRIINKGPRVIDIDLLFVDTLIYSGDKAIVPHPRLFQRSFILKPLQELDIFKKLKQHFVFPKELRGGAWPYEKQCSPDVLL